jgi:hypothetical protein
MKRVRVHRHHRVAGHEQPVHDQAAGLLDDHRHLARPAAAAQTGKGHDPSSPGMAERPPVQHSASIS